MAETFLADITENVLAWNLKPELKKLHNTLSTIKAVLRDADEQQAKNHEVKDWLQKLRDVVYDADDLLDDFGTLILLQKLRSCSGIFTKVRKLFTRPDGLIYRFKITHKIREIRGRLNQISEDRRNFHFKENYNVNPDFSLSKVIEKILRSATGKSFGHLDMDQLQENLNRVLSSGRYLLVLDDVWNEDQHKWKNLRELLMRGCEGSRVIVTTRSIKVAKITGTTTEYNLSGLSDHDCFDLFLKCAFRDQEYRPRNLVEIGQEIVQKCWGVPLAVKTLGNGDRELENLGNQYFNELLSRFCFQDVVEAFDGEILACKIHNLVHDLAQSVAGAECLNAKSGDPEIPESVHHLFFHADNLSREEFPQPLLNLKNLRYFAYSFRVGPISKTFVKKALLNFRRLRVLMLQNLELEELPSSIGFLKQLRYLNLSNNCNIKSLPECICKLVNLQTLNLINCEQLKVLPRNFGQQLMSLKTLYLTSQEISLQKRSSISLGFLQFLLLYKCSCRKFPTEIWQHMKKLRVLRIYECSSLTCLPASIRHLAKLEKLWIWNCEELDLSVGEGMEGLESLQSLLLMGLPKLVSLPSGLKDIYAMKLKYLRVACCPKLTALPDWLQNCTLLQRLYIEDCQELSYLPEQIRSSSNAKVRIIDCPLLNG
nr:putative disease resistance protein RGA1 [Ipomoea batatas]